MNIREALLKEHSRQQCDKIVHYIGNSQTRFDELIALFFSNEYRVVQRAAWALSYSAIAHPSLIKKHLKKLIENLNKPGIHDAVKRNTVRLLQTTEVPPSLHGQIMNVCFRFVEDPDEAVAIKAFSLTVLYNLSKQYPEIIPEIKLLISEGMPRQTAAFASRAKKILKGFESKK